MDFRISLAEVSDYGAVDRLLRAAFEGPLEAALVARLRADRALAISIVARVGEEIVGYVAASPARPGSGLGLAPLAVSAAFRGQGVARALVEEVIVRARTFGGGYMVVLGEPSYYARFGFVPALSRGLSCVFGGGDAFQVLELAPDVVPAPGTVVQYAPAFAIFAPDGSV